MAKFVNKSAGTLGMPVRDGRKVAPGGEIDLDGDTQKIPAVAAWIKAGDLVAVKSSAKKPTDREKAIMAAIEGLKPEDMTQDGKPEVDAINGKMAEGSQPVTADERDAIWAKREQ